MIIIDNRYSFCVYVQNHRERLMCFEKFRSLGHPECTVPGIEIKWGSPPGHIGIWGDPHLEQDGVRYYRDKISGDVGYRTQGYRFEDLDEFIKADIILLT